MLVDRNEYDSLLQRELKKVMNWFNANELLLNIDKTSYTLFGPHYPKLYIKGEHDLADLHSIVPKLYLDDFYEGYSGPKSDVINKKGEFILQELHDVTPNYLVTGLITEKGVTKANEKGIKNLY